MERVRYAQKWKPAIENVTNEPFKEALSDAVSAACVPCIATP